MTELYNGWLVYSRRVGIYGEWIGEAVKDDQQLFTGRFSGKGAKRKALAAIKAKVDTISGERLK